MNDTPLQDITVYLKSSNYTAKIGESNLSFDLNKVIDVQPNIDILIKIDSFQFTNSFYTINQNNQYFYYTLSGGIMKTLTLTNGFYNIDDIVVLLNATAGDGLIFSWDYYTFKITITCPVSFTINDGLSNVYNILGFDSYGVIDYATSFTSPYLFNTMNVQLIKVCLGNIYLNSVEKKLDRRDNILYSFRVSVGPGEIQNFYNTNDFYFKLSDTLITSLNIQLLDQNDNFILFNGIEWFMSINITFQYKKALIPAHYLADVYKVNQPIDEYDTAAFALLEEQKKHDDQIADEIIEHFNLLQ